MTHHTSSATVTTFCLKLFFPLFFVLYPVLPLKCVSEGHHVMTTPAPHAGVAVVAALNILEGYNITSQMLRNSTFHWIAEVIHTNLTLHCIRCAS